MATPQHRPTKVCHFTSVHPYDDVRIFQKQCRTLAASGFEVHLVAAGAPEGEFEGVHVHGVPGSWTSRAARMAKGPWRIARVLRTIDASIYHFHDPELLPVGLWLRSKGKRVVYDAHEDLPRDLYSKRYLGPFRGLLRWPVEVFEDAVSRRLSAVVTATPFIGKRFARINPETVVVNNYPLLHQYAPREGLAWKDREDVVVYAGVIAEHRGLYEMVEAMGRVASHPAATLELLGNFTGPEVRAKAMAMEGWKRVRERGQVGRAEVAASFGRAKAGIVLFHPEPNHVNAQPNKLFEYMSAGLPLIASDFPLWRELIVPAGAGLVVDPLRPDEIARAIEFVLGNPGEAEAMGRRGREAVLAWCNWEQESRKLVALYERLCEDGADPGTEEKE